MMALRSPDRVKQFGYGRFLFLGLISVALSMSLFLTVLAPLPLAFAATIYGRSKGLLLGVGCSVLAWFWGSDGTTGHMLFAIYLFSLVIATVISEVVLRKIKPIVGLLKGGILIVSIIGIIVAVLIGQIDKPVREHLTVKVQEFSTEIIKNKDKLFPEQGESSRKMFELLSRPDLIAAEIVRIFPSYVVIGVFFTLWLNIILLLKSMRVNFMLGDYPYTERNLLSFKMPDYYVWPAIFALAFHLGADLIGAGEFVNMLVTTVIYVLGLFYFFQGVGIYVEFLNFLKIGNFLRSFLMMVMVVTIPWLLAIVGLFDMWVDFRDLMKKKNKKNEN